MTYDNEAIVRHPYHTGEVDVPDVAGFVGSFAGRGAIDVPTADFWHLQPDFASAVAGPVAAR